MTYPVTLTFRRALILCVASAALSLSACGESSNATATNAPVTNNAATEAAPRAAVTHVDAKGAQALLSEKPDMVVLDIRTPKEIDGGYIEGAVFADYYGDNFKAELSKLDRDTPYIVHCKAGGRSNRALSTLAELGFTNITHMDGGLDSWKRENLPLTKP